MTRVISRPDPVWLFKVGDREIAWAPADDGGGGLAGSFRLQSAVLSRVGEENLGDEQAVFDALVGIARVRGESLTVVASGGVAQTPSSAKGGGTDV